MFSHISVLLEECIEGLNIRPNGIYVDATLGGAGHSCKILEKLNDKGKLYCFDKDLDAIAVANGRLMQIRDNYQIIHADFSNLREKLYEEGVKKIDGILFDIGVSSYQFDTPSRGFSYKYDARLDMRMDQSQKLSAYEVVNLYSKEALTKIFYNYGKKNLPNLSRPRLLKQEKFILLKQPFNSLKLLKVYFQNLY